MVELNKNEVAVFTAVAQEIINCTNGQFGYSEDVMLPEGINRAQFSGYMSQLVQKGLFTVDDEYGQVQVSTNFADTARQYQVCVGKSFENASAWRTNSDEWVTV